MLDQISRIKQLRYRAELSGLQAVAAVVRRLPYDSLEFLGDALGSLVYHLDARGRGTSMDNLATAFGDKYGVEEREIIARKSYQSFARTILCLFWSPNLTADNYAEFIRVEGTDNDPVHTDPALAGVYFLGHFSNFEWLSWVSSHAIAAGLVITQGFKNAPLGPIFDTLRAGSGHTIIPRARAIVRMLKFLKTGGKVGAAIDMSLDPRLGAVPVQCFGLWTPMSPMASLLATRAKAALVPSLIFPSEDGRFRVEYRRPVSVNPDASDQQIAQACWDVFEVEIRRRPELWLWSYKQWRFRPTDDTSGRYPRYSNASKRFDRMLRESGVDPANPECC
jgi:lauroyl/myristoyl acyltransferase